MLEGEEEEDDDDVECVKDARASSQRASIIMFAEEAVLAGVQSTGFTICCMHHSRKLQGNLRWVYSKFEWGV